MNFETKSGPIHDVLEGKSDELSLAEFQGAREPGGAIGTDCLAAALDVGKMGLGDPQQSGEVGLGKFLGLSVREQKIPQSQRPKELVEELPGIDALSTYAS